MPAAAVIRGEQALFGFTGRKGRVGGHRKSVVKSLGLTRKGQPILRVSSPGEVSGIPSVEVKFVDIRKNTSGEGGSLARY